MHKKAYLREFQWMAGEYLLHNKHQESTMAMLRSVLELSQW